MEEKGSILFIDNKKETLKEFCEYLRAKHYPVARVLSIKSAIDVFLSDKVEMVICHARLTGGSIEEFINETREYQFDGPFVVLLNGQNTKEKYSSSFVYTIKDSNDFATNEKYVQMLYLDDHKRTIMMSPLVKWKENYSLSIPSDFLYMDRTISYLLKHIAFSKASHQAINSLRMALAEALSNAIEHGNKKEIKKQVHIRLEITRNYVKMTVRDEGEGFDYKKHLNDPNDLNSRFSHRGRGLYIIHKFMDSVTFKNKGNTIIMKKLLTMEGKSSKTRNNKITTKK